MDVGDGDKKENFFLILLLRKEEKIRCPTVAIVPSLRTRTSKGIELE